MIKHVCKRCSEPRTKKQMYVNNRTGKLTEVCKLCVQEARKQTMSTRGTRPGGRKGHKKDNRHFVLESVNEALAVSNGTSSIIANRLRNLLEAFEDAGKAVSCITINRANDGSIAQVLIRSFQEETFAL